MKEKYFQIRITKNKAARSKNIRINFQSVRVKPITDQEYNEYKQTFGKIVADHSDNYSYLLSDLLNREDGSTHFLDKLLKYLECINLVEKHDNVTIYNVDRSVLISLKNYFSSRDTKISYSITLLTCSIIKDYAYYLMRSVLAFLCDSLLIFYAKIKLANKLNKTVKKVFISYFDHRSITNGRFTDPYFKFLQEYLREIGSSFAVVNIVIYGYRLRKGIAYINNIKKLNNQNITTLFNLIPYSGFISTFLKSYQLRPRVKHDIFFLKYNISDLVSESLRREFISCGLQYTFERSYLSRLLRNKFIDAIYYPFENFAWEKFLCLEKQRISANVKLIGFQHTSISLKLQHHFPSVHEKHLKIFPSRIVTTGEITKKVLQKYGSYPSDIMQSGCALRHNYIFDILSDFKCSDRVNRKIAFAFSFDVKRYRYIIEKIISIFGGKDLEILLKYHPLHKEFKFNDKSMPKNIRNGTNISWKKTMEQIDLLLYEGNSVCIDALAYNIPALYFPFTGNLYNTDQLYDYEWDVDAGNEESTYYEKIEELLDRNLRNDEDFFNYNRKYVTRYFHPITKDALQRFVDFQQT